MEQQQAEIGTGLCEYSLTELSVFIGTIVASVGGLVGIIFNNARRSRCTSVSCCGLRCIRNVVPDSDSDVSVEVNKTIPIGKVKPSNNIV
jgi:hypothetical protein